MTNYYLLSCLLYAILAMLMEHGSNVPQKVLTDEQCKVLNSWGVATFISFAAICPVSDWRDPVPPQQIPYLL